ERTGVSLFYKEMDSYRSSLVNQIFKNSSGNIVTKKISKYSTPISDNINTVRDYESLTKMKSKLFRNRRASKLINESLSNLLTGTFKHDEGETVFIKQDDKGDVNIPISQSSSSIKSLFLLDLYARYVAEPGGFLIIDEPELNLHPENQVKIAELLVRLVNFGIKIIMTTHSDYIIKEINNRVMLSNVKDKSNLYGMNFEKEDVISESKISAFTICDDGKIKEIEVSKYGINNEIFDEVIYSMNDRNDLIFNALSLE
ncbi:AAA family ATPase, partial [Providencia stuartii]